MMSTRDLYEMAAMDVLGLLDDEERQDFESAFRAASPELQAKIRREQRRQANIEEWLPAVDEPVGLKARVMSAVRDAIASMSEPVATITPQAKHSWASSVTVWRAACIGFATASVILAGFFYVTNMQLHDIQNMSANNDAQQQFQTEYGARFHATLASPDTHRVAFKSVSTSGKQMAVLYIDPNTQEAFLMCDNLPFAAENYQLSIGGSDSQKLRKLSIGRGGEFFLHIDSITVEDAKDLIIEDSSRPGRPILTTSDTI